MSVQRHRCEDNRLSEILVRCEVKAEVFTIYIPLGNEVGFRLCGHMPCRYPIDLPASQNAQLAFGKEEFELKLHGPVCGTIGFLCVVETL